MKYESSKKNIDTDLSNKEGDLIIANTELLKTLALQNQNSKKRAEELIIANKELVFQNEEKEKRADELIIANKELVFQNKEKEKRADELIIANKELAFQNEEKEKRAAELIVLTNINNAEQKKTEDHLAHLAAIVESSADAIISKSLTGIIKSWNRGSEKMFGYTSKEAVGKNISLIIPPEYLSQEKNILERIRKNEIVEHFETVRKKKNGEHLYVSLTLSPLRDTSGNITGISKIARDITYNKKSEELLINANKELLFESIEKEKRAGELIIANVKILERTTELESANKELESVNKELESFSYSVSHDLRAPLRAINGYAKMLKDNSETQLDFKSNRLLDTILINSKKMDQLIDDLLAFSRIGRSDLVMKSINMNDIVTEVSNELKKEQTNRIIEFNIEHLLPAKAESTALRQVWLNLISNAIKYSRQKEKAIIEIGSEIKDDKIVYHIKDNGIGFDMRYAENLFGVFQRLHSDEEFEGTGVGLAIVQRIITKLEGKVWAYSKVNEGATFFFTLNK